MQKGGKTFWSSRYQLSFSSLLHCKRNISAGSMDTPICSWDSTTRFTLRSTSTQFGKGRGMSGAICVMTSSSSTNKKMLRYSNLISLRESSFVFCTRQLFRSDDRSSAAGRGTPDACADAANNDYVTVKFSLATHRVSFFIRIRKQVARESVGLKNSKKCKVLFQCCLFLCCWTA